MMCHNNAIKSAFSYAFLFLWVLSLSLALRLVYIVEFVAHTYTLSKGNEHFCAKFHVRINFTCLL